MPNSNGVGSMSASFGGFLPSLSALVKSLNGGLWIAADAVVAGGLVSSFPDEASSNNLTAVVGAPHTRAPLSMFSDGITIAIDLDGNQVFTPDFTFPGKSRTLLIVAETTSLTAAGTLFAGNWAENINKALLLQNDVNLSMAGPCIITDDGESCFNNDDPPGIHLTEYWMSENENLETITRDATLIGSGQYAHPADCILSQNFFGFINHLVNGGKGKISHAIFIPSAVSQDVLWQLRHLLKAQVQAIPLSRFVPQITPILSQLNDTSQTWRNSMCEFAVSTNADSCTIYSDFRQTAIESIAVFENDVLLQELPPPGTSPVVQPLGVAGPKVVSFSDSIYGSIYAGYQIVGVEFNSPAILLPKVIPARRLVVVGDSIVNGPSCLTSWIALARPVYTALPGGGRCTNYSMGGMGLDFGFVKQITGFTTITQVAVDIASCCDGTVRNDIWVEIAVNSIILTGLSPVAFQAQLDDLIIKLQAACVGKPGLNIYLQSLSHCGPIYEPATLWDGGFVFADYRTVQQNVAITRGCIFVDGSAFTGQLLPDELHWTAAGHATNWAAPIRGVLGV